MTLNLNLQKTLNRNLKLMAFTALTALVACTTPGKYDSLAETERMNLQSTTGEIHRLAECTESTQGNDALFNAKCSKLLDQKKLFVKVREVDTSAGSYKLIGDTAEESYFVCQMAPTPESTSMLSKLKNRDGVFLTGKLKSFKTTEKNSPFRKHVAHEIDLESCDVKL